MKMNKLEIIFHLAAMAIVLSAFAVIGYGLVVISEVYFRVLGI